MNNKILSLLLLLNCAIVFSQSDVNPTPSEINLAKDLKIKYDNSDVTILKSEEKVNFNLNKKSGMVEAKTSTSETLLNINHRADIHKVEFYDSQSEISTFSIKYKNNKNAGFFPKDEFYKSDDLFYNDARVKYFQIDFPVQGYKYLYNAEKKYKDVKYFTTIYFNDEFPVIEKEVEILIPKWLDLEIKEFNFNGFDITKKETLVEENGRKIVYTIKNIKKEKDEPNTKGPSYNFPHILFVAKSFTDGDKKTVLFEKTDDLYKWYRSLIDSMDEKPEVYKEFVSNLVKNSKTDLDKIKTIYYWVQDNVRYIAFEDGIAGFKPDESQNVYTKKYGDCKGMANLLKQMLKSQGFDARLCWIGTSRIAYDYSIPSLSVDNHMICALFKDGKYSFLDGTEKYNAFGEYADRIQGKEALIEDGEKFILQKIPTQKAELNQEVTTINFAVDGETLKGNVTSILKGESKASFLYQINNIKNNKKDEVLSSYLSLGNKNNDVSNAKTSDLTNRDQDLNITYDLTIENSVSKFDNEMYIDFDYLKEFKFLDFKERKGDYVFDFKILNEKTISFKIPEGYRVEKLPSNFEVKNPQFEVSLQFKSVGNTIVYTTKFHFPDGKIEKQNIKEWQKAFEIFSKLYSEQIVLTK